MEGEYTHRTALENAIALIESYRQGTQTSLDSNLKGAANRGMGPNYVAQCAADACRYAAKLDGFDESLRILYAVREKAAGQSKTGG